MPLAEPMTVATDGLLAALAAVLAIRLLRDRASLPGRLVGAGFLALAGAALLGASAHGLAPHLELETKTRLWRLIYGGIGAANLLLLAAFAVGVLPAGGRALVMVLLGIRFGVFLGLAFDRDFSFVMGDLALSLLLLLGLGLFFTLARPRPFGAWLVAAVVVSLLGALVQSQRLAPHPSFNHNDLFHVVQMLGLYLFYRAARALPALPPEA